MIRFCARIFQNDVTKYNFDCLLSRIICVQPPLSNAALFCQQNFSVVAPKEQTEGKHLLPHAMSIIKNAQELGFTEDEVKAMISDQPDLLNSSPNSWNDVVGSLHDGGFEKIDISELLVRWPKILSMKKKDLDKSIDAWMKCALGQDLCVDVLVTHPHFFKVNHTHVLKRVKQYQIYFESKKRIGKLLLLAPNTLEESWSVLQDKLNYLDELCTEKSDVAASGVLAHSLFHIRVRHEFLIRAGLYKKPQKNYRKSLSKNPKLTSIVNTSDQNFVNNSKLSMFEYQVFVDMFRKQVEEEIAKRTYSDDDDGDDL